MRVYRAGTAINIKRVEAQFRVYFTSKINGLIALKKSVSGPIYWFLGALLVRITVY